jgi:hypothetical protein
MPNYHLSKKAHQVHAAKQGLAELGRQLQAGLPVSPEEHARLTAMHAEGEAMEDLFLCPFGGGHTFKPEPWPDNTYVAIAALKITLPGGQEVHRHNHNDVMLPLLLAICGEHGADEVARAVMHDWAEHDEYGKSLRV